MKTIISNESQRDFAIKYLQGLKFDNNKKFIFECKLLREIRTLSQNSLYWAWLSLLQNETGQDKEDLHEYFKNKFLLKEREILNEEVKIPQSTTILDTKNFTDYLEKIRLFISETLGFYLPEPQDKGFAEFYHLNE